MTEFEKAPGVYLILCTENNKRYIGSSKNVQQRVWDHRSVLRNNKHSNAQMQNSYNKYGKESFVYSVLEYVKGTTLELIAMEQYYIDLLKPEFNSRIVAESNAGKKSSPDSIAKMRKSLTGLKRTEETKQAIKKARTGMKFPKEWADNIKRSKQNISEETRKRMSESAKKRAARLGMQHVTEAAAKVNTGTSRSKATRKKIAQTKQGKDS